MDWGSVQAALAELVEDETSVLGPSDVGEVVVEDGWAAVVLAKEGASKELLARVHQHLKERFPEADFEVRSESQVYRGGAGFGRGRHVVAVLGGKGGVGKSTMAVNLALTLAAMGLSIGLLDGDISAPDVPHLFGIHPKTPPKGLGWRLWSAQVTPLSKRPRPQERFGVELMSVGFVVPERLPTMITGRAWVSALLRHLVFEVTWSADVLIVDAPPGTGEELQVMAGELPLSGALFVTTPQDLAQMDAERTLALLTEQEVPVIGVVQNMASLECPHCERDIDMFAQSTRLTDAGVPVLGRIPFDIALSAAADRGRPLVLGDPRGPIAYEFARIGNAVRRWLAERADGQAAGL